MATAHSQSVPIGTQTNDLLTFAQFLIRSDVANNLFHIWVSFIPIVGFCLLSCLPVGPDLSWLSLMVQIDNSFQYFISLYLPYILCYCECVLFWIRQCLNSFYVVSDQSLPLLMTKAFSCSQRTGVRDMPFLSYIQTRFRYGTHCWPTKHTIIVRFVR